MFGLVLLTSLGFGQENLIFKKYSVEDGLVSNTIWAINQDAQGYMWFGTRNGLSRFDGYEFKSYQFSNISPNSLGNNFVHTIFTYDEGHLWVGTSKGVYILNLKTELFVHFEPLGEYIFNDIQEDPEGNVWLGSNRGLYKYTRQSEVISKIEIPPDKIRKIAFDDHGNVWIASAGRGLFLFYPRKDQVINFNMNNSELLSNFGLTVYKDKKGRIWSGSFGGGLALWLPESGEFKSYMRKNSAISSNIVRSILQVNADQLLVGTEKGLNILNISTETFTDYTHSPSDINSLGGNAVYNIFHDNDNGIWLGTYFGGLSYYSNRGNGFERYYPGQDKNTLMGGGVSSIQQDKAGKFWIGTEDAGLNYFDSRTGTFSRYPFDPKQDPLSYFNVLSLEKKNNKLFIGTFSGGLNIYDTQTGKVRVYKKQAGDPTSLSGNSVHSIYLDKEGIVWVGTSNGLNIYDVENDSFIRVKAQGLSQRFITDIYEDDTGVMWIAVNGGELISKRKKSGQWKRYTSKEHKELYGLGRFSIIDDHEGHLWLATEGNGLVRFSFRDESFRMFGKDDGIDANVVYDILQQDDRTLWLSTNNGIYHFDPHTENATHYTTWDNLQSNDFNYNAGYIASDGRMFFGGINGFNTFYPDSITIRPLKANIVINDFQLFNNDVTLNQPGQEVLSQTINYSDHIELSHRQSVISFEYAALNFESPRKIRYAYKMEGFDKQWNFVGSQRKATYTNLPPGEYTFQVRATNNQKNWSGPMKTIGITIQPPFYRHPAAYVIYAIALFFLIVITRKIYRDRAEKRNRIKLEQLSIEREKEFYNQKIEFFTNMAHELRTPLSLITAPLEKLLDSDNVPDHFLHPLKTMDENSKRLINLINQLLDFRRIESDIYEIRKERIDLVTLVQDIYSRFSAMKYQKNVKFSMSTKLGNLPMMADPEALTKIFNNLLINAFKFTSSEVSISVQEPITDENKNNYCLTIIKDDGAGIPAEELENIFKKYFKVSDNSPSTNLIGTGIGLYLAKSLIEKHNGYLEVDSIPEKHTVFKVFLPYMPKEESKEIFLSPDKTAADIETYKKKATATENILVVEDDPLLLDFFNHNLLQEGYGVYDAKNGLEAWSILEKHDVNLVLSDVMMPLMDGLELCKKIKTANDYSHIPVVLLTAKTTSEAEISGIQNGADAYIAKPFKWKHIVAVTKNLIKSRERLKEKFASHPFLPAKALTENIGEQKFLEKISKVIEERITDSKLSVKELSLELGMSRSSLHRKLKSVTGIVPNEFIRLFRLKHAAKLLQHNEFTISEITYMSGFNSPSYFTRCFSEQFKMTPSEFLESLLPDHKY